MRGMPSRDQVVAHYAEVSGRQVDDLDYYLVLAKWKLAIVLEQGFQRAGDDEKLLAFGPVVTDLMASAAELAESTDYRVTCAPRSARRTGRRRWSASRSSRRPTVADGQVRVRVAAAAVNFPDVLLVAGKYQISVPPPFVPGSEFAGVIVEIGVGDTGFRRRRPGHRHRACSARSPRRSWCPPPAWPDPRRRRRPHRRRVRRRVPHGVSHAALDGAGRSRRRADRARRGRRRRAGRGAARRRSSARRSPRWRRRPKSSTWQPVTAHAPHQPPRRRPARRAARRAARRRRRGRRPGRRRRSPNPRCGRCAAAAGSSPSGTRPASSPASR